MNALTEGRRRVLERSDLYAPVRREWTLRELLAIFRRRRLIVIGCESVLVVLAALYCAVATPRYTATGQIEVLKDEPGTLGLDRSITGASTESDSSSLDVSMALQTEARVLQSSTLALRVIKDLKLEGTADYFQPGKKGFKERLLFWRKPLEPLSLPLDEAPRRRFAALKIFSTHLKVAPVTGTRLIDVSYSSSDPEKATAVVNALMAALRKYTFESRFQATAQASDWLSGQLEDLKKQTEELQETANRLEQGTGIYGDDASHNLVLARLDGLNSALAAAESNRMLKQAVWEVAKSGDPELISGLAGNASTGASPAMVNSLALLQTLRAKEASVKAQIDEDTARYGSAFPEMKELRGELKGVDKSIQEESGRIGARAHTDYKIAQQAEDAARVAFEKQKEIATETNDRTVAYELAKQDADASRGLYSGLLGKLKEAGVLGGLQVTNLAVVTAGTAPPVGHPQSPNVPLCLATALAGGLFLGCAGALVQEATDLKVRSVEELERTLGVSLAGVVPEHGRPRRFGRERRSRQSILAREVLELQQSLALPRRGESSQAVLITSAAPGDGKTRMAVSLAGALARSGAQVLLVDADLLCPSLHTLLGKELPGGLAEALASGKPVEAELQSPGLWTIRAGDAGEHSTALLASARMDELVAQWRSRYDFVLLDSAPVLAVPDAASLARFCDRTLLVVRYGSTTMQAAQRSYGMLRRNLREKAELEVVMNGVPRKSPDYFAYYGYRGSEYGRRIQ